MKQVIITLLIIVGYLTNSSAQGGFELHLAPSIPVGDFAMADFYSLNAGCAATGFNLGVKYMLPLKQNKLFLNFGMDCFYNELNSDIKNANPNVEFGSYVNIPFTVGVMFQKSLFKKVSFWGEANGGANISTLTTTTGSFSDYSFTEEVVPTTVFCYSIGMGLLFNDRISLGISYNALGSPIYDYTVSYSDGDPDETDTADAQNISTISLSLGIRLFKSHTGNSNKEVTRPVKYKSESASPKSVHGGKR